MILLTACQGTAGNPTPNPHPVQPQQAERAASHFNVPPSLQGLIHQPQIILNLITTHVFNSQHQARSIKYVFSARLH